MQVYILVYLVYDFYNKHKHVRIFSRKKTNTDELYDHVYELI